MNFNESGSGKFIEAQLKYLDGDYAVLRPGEFVRCAVSGDPIRLENLRYWSVEKQVAFKSALQSYQDLQGK